MYQEKWKPDPFSTIPLFTQIEQFLKDKILSGEWTIGTRLPSQRELAKAFKVNRSTIVTALDELKAQGFIVGNSGGGTKVIHNTWNRIPSPPPPDWNAYVERGIHHPNLPTIQDINRAEFYPEIIRLGTGELAPELLPMKQLQGMFEHLPWRTLSLGYEDPKGNLLLREQVAAYLKEKGIHTSPASILIVSGALQALQLVSQGLLEKGSTVLLEKQSYLYSVHVFQSAGMKLLGVPMDEQGVMPVYASRLKRQHKAAMLYLNPTFHNPTGSVMREERRKQMLDVCRQEQLPILEDDAYRDLWLDATPPEPLKAKDNSGLVLYLGSMSKALSPGLRIGWIVGPEPVINRLADIKMQMDYGSSSISQWIVYQFLSTHLYQEHIEHVRSQLKIRRDTALAALERHFSSFATWNVPTGSFYIWVRLLPSLSFRRLFEKALKVGILINPGHLYEPHPNPYLRISYSYAALHDLESGIAKLSELIQENAE